MKELLKLWCEETKRNGSVLVSGSIYEFFDWLSESGYTVIKGKVEQVQFHYEEGEFSRVAFLPVSKKDELFKEKMLTESMKEGFESKYESIFEENGPEKVKYLYAEMM
jgi:hypothetical protein